MSTWWALASDAGAGEQFEQGAGRAIFIGLFFVAVIAAVIWWLRR
jgi:hypothetical protein